MPARGRAGLRIVCGAAAAFLATAALAETENAREFCAASGTPEKVAACVRVLTQGTPAERAKIVAARGIAAYAAGDHEGAVAIFDRALALDPADAQALYVLGLAHYAQTDFLRVWKNPRTVARAFFGVRPSYHSDFKSLFCSLVYLAVSGRSPHYQHRLWGRLWGSMGKINRLTARGVTTIKTPGRHADGGGLYLVVGKSGSRSWVLLATYGGQRHEIGIGSARAVSLAEARRKATELRAAIAAGVDPLAKKRAQARGRPTFGSFVEARAAEWSTSWRSAKHGRQWLASLQQHAAALWPMDFAKIDTALILDVLTPIWSTKSETASRVRGRIEQVLDAARVAGLREGENPARWRGHLDHLLRGRAKHDRTHFNAMPIDNVPRFMRQLDSLRTPASDCLALLVLTGVRSREATEMTWTELADDVWTVAPSRTKNGKPHRVPLSAPALAILRRQPRSGNFVFAGRRRGRPLVGSTLRDLMRALGEPTASVHGFRSTLRDWISERTTFPRSRRGGPGAHHR